MISAFIKLLVLLAALLMPLGMAVPAAAAPHHEMASMPMQHCPEQAPAQKGKSGFADCTMACAAALPAVGASPDNERSAERSLAIALPVHQLHGLHPEIATPPPKRS